MHFRKSIVLYTLLALGASAAILTLILVHRQRPIILKGAVLRQDRDADKQTPIADVQVTAINTLGTSTTTSDSAGFFSLTLPKGLRRRRAVQLHFRNKDYRPLDVNDFVSDKLYIARMTPLHVESSASIPAINVSNTRVRYSVKATTEAEIGSAVKTFQVTNVGNVPCSKHPPCSPDGRWKATVGSMSLDAGEGNQFRNARVSCIAGPCAFTKIELENLSQDSRYFNVSVRNWSDSTTFLLEAEVVHPMVSNIVRESYPVIFGRALNFSLPAGAGGPSIQAELNGETIVFPLGPDLLLRWADCHVGVDRDQSRNYRCELKPGYVFQ